MARVFDCFTFFNEFDVLDLRLRMHNDFIDFFVVCESKKTWMQGDKELYLKNELNYRFPEFSQKIILLDSTEMFLSENPWANEESQRNFLLEGIPLDISEDDLMIVSDVDELISQGILEQFKSSNSILSKIQIDFFYYNLRWRANEKWNKVFILKGKYIINNRPTINLNLLRNSNEIEVIKSNNYTGAHLSFFYGTDYEMYATKVKSYNHQEYNRPFYLDKIHLEYCITYGKDIFCRPYIKFSFQSQLKGIPSGEVNPKYLPQNCSLFQRTLGKYKYLGYYIKRYMFLKYGLYSESNSFSYWFKTLLKKSILP